MKMLRSVRFRASRGSHGRRRPVRMLLVGIVLAAACIGPALTETPARAAGGTTVEGPRIWIPDTHDNDGTGYLTGTFGDPGTVTVDQTQNLGDQVVHVSWTGFTPTTNETALYPTYVAGSDATDMYSVRVYQCRGLHPEITDCYGSTLYNADRSKGFDQVQGPSGSQTPEFASNSVLAVTRPDGTGDADLELWTARESQSLGCDLKHACSIVVVPNYGGDFGGFNGAGPNCDDHTLDTAAAGFALATPYVTGLSDGNGYQDGERCAWNSHVVVPLSFAPTPDNCTATKASFTAEGLPMFARAGDQWTTGLCLNRDPVVMQYAANLTEPIARTDFLQGGRTDVAFTNRPADPASAHAHPYVYAPLANSGIVVAYVVDDPNTGQQVRRPMRLNARLLAKMLTQSYNSYGYDGSPPIHSVEGNPYCIFVDPEFQQLNPPAPEGEATWPTYCSGPSSVPIVGGGLTDLTYQLTSYIAGDPDARAFLQGAPDPWGMHVDTFYLPKSFSGYPVESFVPQDASGFALTDPDPKDPNVQSQLQIKSYEWNPLQSGLAQVARNVQQNQPTCIEPFVQVDGTHLKCAPLPPSQRNFFAVLDAGQAAAFRLSTASLENPAGGFVSPTLDGMAKAVGDMVVDKATKTQHLPYGDAGTDFGKDVDAYPLTAVQYAMVPTGGVDSTKAGKIAEFIRTTTASGGGQIYGFEPGQLAAGFLALSSDQQAQAAEAADHVANQDETPPAQNSPSPRTTSPSRTPGGRGSSSGIGKTPTPTDSGPGAGSTPKASTLAPLALTGVSHPDQANSSRLVLPAVLIAGSVLLLGGPLAAVLLGTGAGAGLAARLRRARFGRP